MSFSIVKELTGEVSINDYTSGETIKQLTESSALIYADDRLTGGVWVIDKDGQSYTVETSRVVDTQILPAAAVAFTGTTKDLYELLEKSFFLNILNPVSGGGGVNETNILLQGINYTITTADYIIVATADITLTLPASPNTGQLYKIFSAANTVTLNANAGQNIIGKTGVTFKNNAAIMVQYVKTNFWGII